MSRRRIAHLIVALLVLASAGPPAHGSDGSPGLLGKEAPSFEGKDLEGNPVTLARLRQDGTLILINFWGLRCRDCIREIPYLNAMHSKYGKSGLKILGVNVDGLSGAKVKEMMESGGIRIDYPSIPDPEFKMIDAYRLAGAPLNVIIDPSGKVVSYHEGFLEGEEGKLEAEIVKFLPRPAAKKGTPGQDKR